MYYNNFIVKLLELSFRLGSKWIEKKSNIRQVESVFLYFSCFIIMLCHMREVPVKMVFTELQKELMESFHKALFQ